MIEEFHSIDELYNRVVPALQTRIGELQKMGCDQITSDDIWNYLVDNRWKSASELTLFDVVDDILNIDVEKITNYINNKS